MLGRTVVRGRRHVHTTAKGLGRDHRTIDEQCQLLELLVTALDVYRSGPSLFPVRPLASVLSITRNRLRSTRKAGSPGCCRRYHLVRRHRELGAHVHRLATLAHGRGDRHVAGCNTGSRTSSRCRSHGSDTGVRRREQVQLAASPATPPEAFTAKTTLLPTATEAEAGAIVAVDRWRWRAGAAAAWARRPARRHRTRPPPAPAPRLTRAKRLRLICSNLLLWNVSDASL